MKLLNWAKLNKLKTTIICLALITTIVSIGVAVNHVNPPKSQPDSIIVSSDE